VASVLQMTNDQQRGLRQSQVHALFKLLGLVLCQICYTIQRGEFQLCVMNYPQGRRVRGHVALFMAALRSRCGHYIFALWFLSSIFFLFLA